MSVPKFLRLLPGVLLLPAALAAQTAPPPAVPSIKVGAVIFSDLTLQQQPKTTDVDGNSVSRTSFNITRSYVNVTGNLTKRIAFRITPDIVRESGTGSSISGSYTYRLKYAYGQVNLDEWAPKGSFARFGMQQTPYIDYLESVYTYRFIGPTFADREGFATSSDLGISGRYVFPGEYGDIQAGVYNGEGYAKAETNDQKSAQARVSFRPFPGSGRLRGLRFAAFANADHYVRGAPRDRFIVNALYGSDGVSGGVEYLTATDQTRASAPELDAEGWSMFVAPHLPGGLDVLVRHDEVKPDDTADSKRTRNIVGLVYWLPLEKVSSAISLDYEDVTHDGFSPARDDEKRWAIHTMISF